jgi:predicted ribosome quality control (RQC) complex YloA/Tae2 family protein
VVTDLRDEPPHRFRLLLSVSERPRTILISLDPNLPWIGRPHGRRRRLRIAPGVFAPLAARRLRGAALVEVAKPAAERCVTLHFSDGRALAVELLTHGANLILLDPEGRIEAVARRPRGSRRRLEPGVPYRPASPPPGRLDPFEIDPARLRGLLRTWCSEGRTEADALERKLLGVGRAGAELAVAEAGGGEDDLATVLLRRLADLREARSDPCVEAPVDPWEASEQGALDEAACRLWPWEPPWPPEKPRRRIELDDAATTAGLYHEAVDLARMQRVRSGSLVTILEREIRRLREVEIKVTSDMKAFRDADRLRHWGEALLAGLSRARRAGEHVFVPDPYDPEQATIPVPVPPGQEPARAAEVYFSRHRRAVRGLERAQLRASEVAQRRGRLERLLAAHGDRMDPAAADALESAMQGEGIPVGLEAGGRPAGGGPRPSVSRVEGVRLFLSGDGDAVMVGKSGRDNHRLTFKLAHPEDFWLHALGVPGAHVVVRNPRRQTHPSPATLSEAAEAAAWFSEAREQPQVDVQWTRRKYVRKIRGASPGTVRVKRSETVRVRPRRPGALEGRG